MSSNIPKVINSISEVHRFLGLAKPQNPFITLIDHSTDINPIENKKIIFNFYNITLKQSFQGQLKYGKSYYDFDEGSMSFLSPNQVLSIEKNEAQSKNGWSLLFHADLIRNHNLGKQISKYGFFSYEANEALHLSDKEQTTIEELIRNIKKEYNTTIDLHSEEVIVANLELLLKYCNRFYSRQFITRKMASNDLLIRFEHLLKEAFEEDKASLPSVRIMAENLKVSSNYLSDMLRTVTGQNTQQYIHNMLIEKAKEKLSTTTLSVSEIAFQLGFEYAQSFNKLFKNKTKLSPLEYRKAFHS